MNENILRILDNSLLYSLWIFLVSFLVSLIFVAIRLRARSPGLAEHLPAQLGERRQVDSGAAEPPEVLLSDRPRMAVQAALTSTILSVLCFVVLAFTPITFFENFANQDLAQTVPLQLTRITHDRTHDGFSLKGEVWNRSQQPIDNLRAVVEIWESDQQRLDQVSAAVTPDPLEPGMAGNFSLDYFKNAPFIHGYQVRFESGFRGLPHLKGFGGE